MTNKWIVAIMACILVVPAHAAIAGPDNAARSTASVRILTPATSTIGWFGVGDVRSTIQLCVASSTGRFRLQMSALANGEGTPPQYDVIFSTQLGDAQTVHSTGQSLFEFEGRTAGPDCSASPNVTLEIRFKRSDLSAALAGQYLQRLQINVVPA